MEESLDDGVLVIKLSAVENELLGNILSMLARNKWVYDDSVTLDLKDQNTLKSMSTHSRELFLSELVAGKNGYNCSGPFQTMVIGHDRSKEIMRWRCSNRDKKGVSCSAFFQISKKGLWSGAHHCCSCLETLKIIDLRILRQKIGEDLWNDAISNVAEIRRINATQDECFKTFRRYIRGTSTLRTTNLSSSLF